MESDDLKEEILNKLQMSLAKQLEPEQVRMVCSVAGMVLNPYTITKTETALSTEVIRPNADLRHHSGIRSAGISQEIYEVKDVDSR